jgi:hypothetical protein
MQLDTRFREIFGELIAQSGNLLAQGKTLHKWTKRQGQCLVVGKSFSEREKNLFAGLLSRDFLSSRA